MFFYKLVDRKWSSAALVGGAPRNPNADGLSNTLAWDDGLKLVLRITHWSREGSVEAFVLRLDAATLKLTPLE